jgi:hypothetical protein
MVTKLTVHCLGDAPGDRVLVTRNIVNVYARIPVNQAEFTKNGKSVDTVKGHDNVDLTITLNAPAPASGTWVRLETTPPAALNSLPPYSLDSGATDAGHDLGYGSTQAGVESEFASDGFDGGAPATDAIAYDTSVSSSVRGTGTDSTIDLRPKRAPTASRRSFLRGGEKTYSY